MKKARAKKASATATKSSIAAHERSGSEIVRDQIKAFDVPPKPGQVTLYAGVCEGGPYHGRNLYHGEAERMLARSKLSGKFITWCGAETSEIELIPYKFEAGKWVWQEGRKNDRT